MSTSSKIAGVYRDSGSFDPAVRCSGGGARRTDARDRFRATRCPVRSYRDDVVAHVVRRAEGCPAIFRVVLFGSRARGDASERSDYDFAIEADGLTHAEWSRWCLDTSESAPTLCSLDLVLASEPVREDLRRAIETEGVTIYERRANAARG
jgi:predicted nucleotidyltransferase